MMLLLLIALCGLIALTLLVAVTGSALWHAREGAPTPRGDVILVFSSGVTKERRLQAAAALWKEGLHRESWSPAGRKPGR